MCCAAIAFFTEVMEVAEAEGHHPDLHLTNYRDVRVGHPAHAVSLSRRLAASTCSPSCLHVLHLTQPCMVHDATGKKCWVGFGPHIRLPFGLQVDLSTHAIGGLSKNDFVVAAKIDAVPTEYSPKWLREHKEKQAAS